MISLSEGQLLAWITPLLWPFLRALALFTALPVLGTRTVPARVRIGLAAFIALCAQASLPAMPSVPLDSPQAFAMVVQQVVIGLTMGIAVRVVFAAIEFAGELVGLQMGLNFAGFFDPLMASQGTATGKLFGTLTAWLFIVSDGHLLVVSALVQSFQTFAVGPEPFAFVRAAQPQQWASMIFSTGLQLALPLVGMLLFVNLTLGLVTRVAPQLSIFSIGFPITLGLGLIGLTATLPMLAQPFEAALRRMLALFG